MTKSSSDPPTMSDTTATPARRYVRVASVCVAVVSSWALLKTRKSLALPGCDVMAALQEAGDLGDNYRTVLALCNSTLSCRSLVSWQANRSAGSQLAGTQHCVERTQ